MGNNRKTSRRKGPLIERLLRRIEVNKATGCWNWLGCTAGGYGRIMTSTKRPAAVHRVAYEHFKGTIPIELELHHICCNTRCCNPDHLEPMLHGDNTRLSPLGIAAINARKTYCKRGHRLSPENVYRKKNGTRQCRICMRMLNRRWMSKNFMRTRQTGCYCAN
jgi:hypothetical protein